MKNNTLLFFFTFLALFNLKSSAQENTNQTDCKSCTVIPGSIDKFKNALTDSKLHYYTDGGKTKLDLKKAALECNPEYFTTCNGLLILTSPGKKKDRTEIRQNKNLALNDYSAMEFAAIFEKVPFTNEKKGVTIGQIHNDTKGVKRPLLRVEIAGGSEIRTVVTDSYLKGEGNVTNDFFTSFTEGDHIECKITINETGNSVTVFVKNTTENKIKTKTYKVSKLWQKMDGEFYFKAGAYTQVSGPKTKVSYDKFDFRY